MDGFSQKSSIALGEFYVYGLVDPRSGQFFYIGKGTGNRVFEHEREGINNPESEKLKLRTIAEIKAAGLEVEKVVINSNLTENEAFAAEASLINAFRYSERRSLTNIVAGHHSQEALTVEEFEKRYGAQSLKAEDIRHVILVIKINRLYQRNMNDFELYNAVRGNWRISKNKIHTIKYVFGVYNSLIVGVYKPTRWLTCKEAPNLRPRSWESMSSKEENRLFFIDESFESGAPADENQEFYFGKSIEMIKDIQKAQNPITYLLPE